jgi:hypothetical protein
VKILGTCSSLVDSHRVGPVFAPGRATLRARASQGRGLEITRVNEKPAIGGMSLALTRQSTARGTHGKVGRSSRSQRETLSSVVPMSFASSRWVSKSTVRAKRSMPPETRAAGVRYDDRPELELRVRIAHNHGAFALRAHVAKSGRCDVVLTHVGLELRRPLDARAVAPRQPTPAQSARVVAPGVAYSVGRVPSRQESEDTFVVPSTRACRPFARATWRTDAFSRAAPACSVASQESAHARSPSDDTSGCEICPHPR